MAPQRLDRLAPELIVDIARHLWLGDMSHLAQVNRRLYQVLDPFLYFTDAQPYNQYALYWAAQHNLPTVAGRALKAGTPPRPTWPEPSHLRPFGKVLSTDEELRAEGVLSQRHMEPLACAAVEGHTDVVAILLEQMPSLSLHQIVTLVELTASKGHIDTVDLLLQYTERTGKDMTDAVMAAFDQAANYGHHSVVERLLETKVGPAKIDTSTEHFRKTMVDAAANGHDALWDILSSAHPVESKDLESYSRLLFSSLHTVSGSGRGMMELTKQLIEFGFDLDDPTAVSRLAKLAACRGDVSLTELFLTYSKEEENDLEEILSNHAIYFHTDVMKMLLSRGVNRAILKKEFMHALQNQRHDVILLYLSSLDGTLEFKKEVQLNIMHKCCELGLPEVVQALLQQGVSASEGEQSQGTTTEEAIKPTFLQSLMRNGRESQRLTIAKLLIQHGADPTKRNEVGDFRGSILKSACEAGLPSVARLLLHHGADPWDKISGGRTILHLVCTYCPDVALIEDLLQRGADVMARSYGSATPLHELCSTTKIGRGSSQSSRYDVAKLLISHGAKPNTGNVSGTTPLHYACQCPPDMMDSDDAKVVLALLEHGADIEKCNINGQTPLHVACSKLNVRVASILIAHGADTSVAKLRGIADYFTRLGGSTLEIGSMHEMTKLLLDHVDDKVMLKKIMVPPLQDTIRSAETMHLLMMRGGGPDKDARLVLRRSEYKERTEALAKALGMVEEEDEVPVNMVVLAWPSPKKKHAPELTQDDEDMLYY